MIYVDNSLVLRYVIPFSFERGYENLYNNLTVTNQWNMIEKQTNSGHVFSHLYQSVYGSCSPNSMGSTWEYLHKPRAPELRYTSDKNTSPTHWRITQTKLHIFPTNIGLLWYELTPFNKKQPEQDLDTLTIMQNRFKECSHTHLHFEQKRPRHSKEEETVFDPFDAAIWLHDILAPLGQVRYFNGSCMKNDRQCPSKALIFNYMLLHSDESISDRQLQKAAFRLTNGYTLKYLPSEEALQSGLHPFEDVYMYASRSGCGYYAILNESNQAFFAGNFNENIRTEYFFLYTLALYQSYSLMNFSRKSAEDYPSNPGSYNTAGEIGVQLDQFLAELNTFLMKGMYTSVSTVQHQNDFYNYVKKRLMIQEDVESIRFGTEALVEMQHMRHERNEARQREKEAEIQNRQDRLQNMTLAVLSLFPLFTVFRDLDELFDKLSTLDLSVLWQNICAGSFLTIAEVVIYVFVIAIMLTCIIILIVNFFPKKEKKKKSDKCQ